MPISVNVTFQTNGTQRFLMHNGSMVPISGGAAKIQCQPGVFEVILFGIQGKAGDTATITLTPPSGNTLVIQGHPITGKIAQGKAVWGDNRFFMVK